MAMVQAVSYNFSTVENPLSNGGTFTTIADANFTGVLKVIAGNKCEEVTANTNAGSFYSGAVAAPGGTWPADQYSEMTFTTFGIAGTAGYLFLRQGSAASGTQYVVSVSSAGTYTFFAFVSAVSHTLATGAQASAQGDVFRFGVVGNVLTLYRNGSSVQTFTDTNNYVAAGSPGLGMITPTAGIADFQTSLWAAGANQAATPTFSPVAGSYTGTQTVTLTSTSGGTIYYTTDGSTPTHASSSVASGSTISVSATETVKAIASVANNLDSATGSAAYTITASAGAFMGSPIPVTISNFAGYALAITSPTLGSFAANPVPVVFCDANGNEYTVTGATKGSFAQAPIPVVLCNSNGLPIVPPIVATSNGNSISITSTLTGNKLGRPLPVCLTDPNGNALGLSGFSFGSEAGSPTPVVLCGTTGTTITATLAT